MKSFYSKTTIVAAITVLIFTSAPVAHAQLGSLLGSFLGGLGGQAVRIITDTSQPSLTTAIKTTIAAITGQHSADSLEQLVLKEEVLDPAAWGVAKQFQQQLTSELLKWLGGQQPGQNGQVPFVQDLGAHYQDIVDDVTGKFIFGQEGGESQISGRCSQEEDFKVKQQVYQNFTQERARSTNSVSLFQCRQSSENEENPNSLSAILERTINCDGNEICAVYKAERELARQQMNAIENESKILDWSQGMLPQRVCKVINDPDGKPRQLCQMVNPAYFAADTVKKNIIELPTDQLLNMDEFNEIASNLMNNLANQALQGITGVLGLTGNQNYSQNIFGADGTLSYADALARDDVTANQTGGTNPIKDSLKYEQDYIDLLKTVLDAIADLENKLAANKQEFSGCFSMELTDDLKTAKVQNTGNVSIADTTLTILKTLDTQYDNAQDAANRSNILGTYNQYKNQNLFRTDYQNADFKISYIELDFAQMVDTFRYDMATKRQECGGSFDYDGVLSS